MRSLPDNTGFRKLSGTGGCEVDVGLGFQRVADQFGHEQAGNGPARTHSLLMVARTSPHDRPGMGDRREQGVPHS